MPFPCSYELRYLANGILPNGTVAEKCELLRRVITVRPLSYFQGSRGLSIHSSAVHPRNRTSRSFPVQQCDRRPRLSDRRAFTTAREPGVNALVDEEIPIYLGGFK